MKRHGIEIPRCWAGSSFLAAFCAALVFSVSLVAQTKPVSGPPVKPPPVFPDLGSSIDALEGAEGSATGIGAPFGKAAASVPAFGHDVAVPKGWKPTVVSVTETGKQAVQMGSEWLGAVNPPAPGGDGRVIFTFGAGLPVIPCARLKVCVIELQPGEHITGAPIAGDTVRWSISPAFVGVEPNITPLLVIKPLAEGIETNVIIPTDRRAYYLQLVSDASGKYVARVGFNYPPDPAIQWKAEAERKEKADKVASQASVRVEALTSIEDMNTDYTVRGRDVALTPAWIGDNGKKTFIKMNASTGPREVPVLMVHGPSGDEIVNFRVVGDMYIVDRLIDSGVLLIGVGKHARRVEFSHVKKVTVK